MYMKRAIFYYDENNFLVTNADFFYTWKDLLKKNWNFEICITYAINDFLVVWSGTSNGVQEPLEKLDNVYLKPRIISKVALTQGDWEVLGKKLWVDEVNSIVYFSALRESVLEEHVYAVSLCRPLEIRLLTRPGYSYSNVYFNKECNMLVTMYSSIKTLPTCQVCCKIDNFAWLFF